MSHDWLAVAVLWSEVDNMFMIIVKGTVENKNQEFLDRDCPHVGKVKLAALLSQAKAPKRKKSDIF